MEVKVPSKDDHRWKLNGKMQKFVVKKISRSTNITISEDTTQCEQTQAETERDLEISSIRMSGYLKKKRNVSFSKLHKSFWGEKCPVVNVN